MRPDDRVRLRHLAGLIKLAGVHDRAYDPSLGVQQNFQIPGLFSELNHSPAKPTIHGWRDRSRSSWG
jgi:hypothetical protein